MVTLLLNALIVINIFYKCIGPKMRNLRHAEQVLEMRKVQLNTKRGELKAMEQRVRSLQQHYSKVNNGQSPGHKVILTVFLHKVW